MKKNAKFIAKKYQKDEYFTPAHKDYRDKKPVEEWLRIRQSSKNSITYKNWHYEKDGTSSYCDEYETEVDDIDQMRKIFAAIDLEQVIVVEKTREIWDYKDYEIVIDNVVGQGDFVEVEYKGSDKNPNPKSVTKEMVEFLREVGCGKLERNYGGYAFAALYPEEAKFIEIE